MEENSYSWINRLFNGTNDFGKHIIKELVDMREAVIRAFAKSLVGGGGRFFSKYSITFDERCGSEPNCYVPKMF